MITSEQNNMILDIAKKLHTQKRINGLPRVCFSMHDANKILIKTNAHKSPNVYLYDTKDDKILWSKKSTYMTSFYVPDHAKVFHLNNQVLIADSSGMNGSYIQYYEITTGNLASEFKANNAWTDVLIFRDGILAGCRDGYLYFIGKDTKLKYKFCAKDPDKDYGNIYNIPSPFCLSFDKEQNYIAFSYHTTLYLLDFNLNFIWSKDIDVPYRTRTYWGRVNADKMSDILGFKKEKYSWAYKILDVNYSSTKEEIKRAYRNQALKWHPDRHEPEDKKLAEERFKKIANAYELIGEANSNELDKELTGLSTGSKITVTFFDGVISYINKIEFLWKESMDKQYIKIIVNNNNKGIIEYKKEVIVGIDGEYLEEQESNYVTQLFFGAKNGR